MTDNEDLGQITEDYARGGFFLFSGAIVGSVILAVSAIIMGRLLGPELYGQYNLILTIPTILLLFTDLGISTAVTKFIASLRAQGKNSGIQAIIHSGLNFRLIVGLVISIISLTFASYFAIFINRPDFTFYVQIACISLIFQAVYNTVNAVFVGLDKSEYNAFIATIRAILTTIIQVALVILSYSVTGALIGYVGGFVVSSIVGTALLFFKIIKPNSNSTNLPKIASPNNQQVLKSLLVYGVPVYVSVVLTGLFPVYQQLVLAYFSSDVAIGNFRAAFNFVSLFSVLTTAITTALLPAISKLELADSKVVSDFFNRANKYACLLIVPLTIIVIILADPIVKLIYGPSYTTAPLFLSLSCSVYLLSIFGFLTMISVFNGLGKTRLTLFMTVINFVVLLVLSPILAPTFGVTGVIVAYLISCVAAMTYGVKVAVKQLKIKFNLKPTLLIYLDSILSIFPAVAIMIFTRINSVELLFLGAVLYLFAFITLIPFLKIMNLAELDGLERVVERLPVIKTIVKPLLAYQRILQSH